MQHLTEVQLRWSAMQAVSLRYFSILLIKYECEMCKNRPLNSISGSGHVTMKIRNVLRKRLPF